MAEVNGGSKCNLITGYSTGEDVNLNYGWNTWWAQTFTLTAQNVVWRCRLKSWTISGGDFYQYAIRATDIFGAPTGADIVSTTLSPTGEDYHSPGKWRRFDFDTMPVLPAGTYALIARMSAPPFSQTVRLRADGTTPTYTGGQAWRSVDAGATWTPFPAYDLMFEVWGWEPPPDPPPEPTPSNWAPVDESHHGIDDGFTITVTTDIPVHLFMRWSLEPPLKHKVERFRRGIALPHDTRYCFVAWKENEQAEAGDTYTHTFEKKNWPVCQTRWFYFTGTKQAEESPSASAIFTLHRTQKDVPIVSAPIHGTVHNRTIRYSWGTWPITHDSPTGRILGFHAAPLFHVRCEARLNASYFIQRGFLQFVLTSIPAGSQILSATLSLYGLSIKKTSSAAYPYLQLTEGVQASPPIPANYGDQLPYTVVGGQAHLDALNIGAYNHIDLNSDGLSWLPPGGIARLCIRQEMDVINTPPPLGANWFWFTSQQGLFAQRPYMVITYLPP